MPKRINLDTSEIIRLYGEGMAEYAIAKQFGVCRDVIKRRLFENGVYRRGLLESAQGKWEKFKHPRIGVKDPKASERMKKANPNNMSGVREKKALHFSDYLRNNPTFIEKYFLHVFEKAGLILGVDYQFQVPAGPYIMDFYFPNLRLNFEVDGRGHYARIERDKLRDGFISAHKIEVIRVFADKRNIERIKPHITELFARLSAEYNVTFD